MSVQKIVKTRFKSEENVENILFSNTDRHTGLLALNAVVKRHNVKPCNLQHNRPTAIRRLLAGAMGAAGAPIEMSSRHGAPRKLVCDF